MLDRGVATVELAEPRRGQTALIAAAAKGHAAALELLLARGGAAGATDFEGYGAIHHAAVGGHVAAARLLLGRPGGVPPTVVPAAVRVSGGRSAKSALELACGVGGSGHAEVVAAIVAHTIATAAAVPEGSCGRGLTAAQAAACEHAAPDAEAAARLRAALQPLFAGSCPDK